MNIYEQSSSSFVLSFVLDDFFVQTVDNVDSEEDTSSWANGAQEIGENGQKTDADTSQGGGSQDVLFKFLVGSFIGVSLQEHTFFLEPGGNFLGSLSRDFNPGSAEECTWANNEKNVDNSMDRISNGFKESPGWGDVIDQTSNRCKLALSSSFLPVAENTSHESSLEIPVKHLGEEIQVGYQGGLQDDGDVRCVEQSDRIRSLWWSFVIAQSQINVESLEENDDQENQCGCQQVADVGQITSEKSILNCIKTVASEDCTIKKLNNWTFILFLGELCGTEWIRDGRETAPKNSLSHVDSNEQTGSRTSDSVSLRDDIVQKHGNDGCECELKDNEDSISSSDFIKTSVHSWPGVSESLSESNENTDKFLSTIKEFFLFSDVLINLDKFSSGEQLHNHGGGDDGGDTQLHKRTSVGGQDDSDPIERIWSGLLDNTVEWDLTA